MFASQGPILAEAFGTVISQAAWKTKPSYGIAASEDKSINPDIERNIYKRSGSKSKKFRVIM